MLFDQFSTAHGVVLATVFMIAVLMGVGIRKTNFCTMGALADYVNFGDTGRIRSWLLAIAVALLGIVILESLRIFDLDNAYPSYRREQFTWIENLLGGISFGIGMTLASGCGSKLLVRVGGGNIKSIVVVSVIAVIAYYMGHPLPGTSDDTLYTLLFYDWLKPFAVDLSTRQDVGSLLAEGEWAVSARLIIGSMLALLLLTYIFRSADFRRNKDNIAGGLIIGVVIVAAWYVTSSTMVNADGEAMHLSGYVENWDFVAESEAGKPAQSKPLSAQSFTIINPMGQVFGLVNSKFDTSLLTYGIMMFVGIILGSLLYSLITHSFRIEWFSSVRDFTIHIIGAVLMGFGGIIAMGCTIGQAITGVSTLSVGSFIASTGIIFGCVLTLKVQYYMLTSEDKAGFIDSLSSSLVNLNLYSKNMRKLGKV